MSGPRETVDSRSTTEQPNAPSGFSFKGIYHAADDLRGMPPYLRRMIGLPAAGTRYDTSVPPVCTASDWQLAMQGPAACPAGTKLGGGSSATVFLGVFRSTVHITLFNGTNQQIMLAESPLFATISRGQIHPDGSTEFASPTCYPSSPLLARCPVDDVLQLESSITVAPYTRIINGRRRSYLTTPPSCPAAGQWTGSIRFWWADGNVDTVVTKQPCHRSRRRDRRGWRHSERRL